MMVHNAHICGTCCTDGIVAYPCTHTHTHASHIMCRNYSKLPPEYCSVLCKCVALFFFFSWLFPLEEKNMHLYWDTFVLQVVGLINVP